MSFGRALATVGGLTMLSRLLGFVRDVLTAAILGAGPAAEAFFVAFRFPNLFRRLFAEGAFNSAFVPLFSKRLEAEGQEAAHRFAEESLAVLLSGLFVLTAALIILMPWAIYAIAAGFSDDAAKLETTVLYTRICFPYLGCMAAAALFSGVLNGMGRFAAAAAAPVVLNIVLISALGLSAILAWPPGLSLSWGVLIAGILQALMLYFAAARAGMRLRLRRPRMTAAVKRLLTLAAPGVVSGGASQINVLVSTTIATYFVGAVAWLSYADRVYQLPLGVVGVAVGVVLLPTLSRHVRAQRQTEANAAFNRAVEVSLTLTLPAAAAMIAIPGLIAAALFERGAFGAGDSAQTARAMMAMAPGLPAAVLIRTLAPCYFAQEDMKTPLRAALAAIVANIVIALALSPFIGFVALALAGTLSGWLNVGILAIGLRRRGAFGPDARLRKRAPRILLASALMAVALAATPLPDGGLGRFGALLALCILGAAVYGLAGRALGAFAIADLKSALRRG